MLKYIEKDVSDITEGIIAQGVNCQYAMGSGLALAIMRKWPIVRDRYMNNPPNKSTLGRVDIIQVDPTNDHLLVANCYTQEYYGSDGKKYASVDAIARSLTIVFKLAQQLNFDLYLPKIGCGLGGLSYSSEVEPIVSSLDDIYDINVFIFSN